jgi:uncharacterized RDD family membrane protein YckC
MAVEATAKAEAQAPRADWGERTGAALVDLAIAIALLSVGVAAGAILIAVGGWAIAPGVILILAGVAGSIVYAPLMLARAGAGNGQTIGKRAAKLRVVRDDGAPVGFWLAVLREVVIKFFFGLVVTGGLFLLVDLLWPLFDDRDRAVHDMISETHVVKTEE